MPAAAEILATFLYPSDASRASGVKVREEGPCSVEVGVDVDEDDFADYGFWVEGRVAGDASSGEVSSIEDYPDASRGY